ncbi:MAG: hypothetical protein V4759_07365 [Pseudomonadota bacterium]
MTDPRNKPVPPPEPVKEGGLKSTEQPPPAETGMIDEAAPAPRQPDREGGMIGEG